ncbi:MAG: AMP-binding protein [Christensenellales bacterium]
MTRKYSYPLYPVEYCDTFRDFINMIDRKYCDRTAVTWFNRKGQRNDRTYHQLVCDAMAFAQALYKAGLSQKHIAVVSENSYEWIVTYLGTVLCGSVAVCIDIEQSTEVLHQMIMDAEADLLVCSPSLDSVCAPLIEKHARLCMMISTAADGHASDNFWGMCSLGRKSLEKEGPTYEATPVTSDQTAGIVFTSGTTSIPRPVMLSHKAILTNALEALAMVEPASTRSFGMLPFYHTYGFTSTILCSLCGGINVCINGDLKTMLSDLKAFCPGTIVAVPLVLETIYKMIWSGIEKSGKIRAVKLLIALGRLFGRPSLFLRKRMVKALDGTGLEKLELLICGGAYLSIHIARDLISFGILVLQGYGITECSPLVSVNRNKSHDLVSVGYVLPSYEVKIKDGEILVRGVSLMNGYYNNPKLTEESLDDGWFKTGDIGRLDKKGRLYISGRIKNLIIMKNGKKISPEEIEARLMTLPMVKEAVAYGAASGNTADDVKVAVTIYPDPAESEGMTSYEILALLQQNVDEINSSLPFYKQIQMISLRDTEFDKTASHKLKRQTV